MEVAHLVVKTPPKLTEAVPIWLGTLQSISSGVVMQRDVKLVYPMPLVRQIL